MNFAFPAALWALPVAGLPILIHMLSARAARRIPFSDLTLLAAISSRLRARSRLWDLLLLAARCLLLAALVVAAAGPAARGSSAAFVGEGLDLVLLLDSSYSMRVLESGSTRFELARRAARGLLKRLAPGDRVALGVFDEGLKEALAWTDVEGAERSLSAATVGFRGTNAGAALDAARALLESSPRGRRRAVVVLGDGAAHMNSSPVPAPAEDTVVLGLGFPERSNSWISAVRATPDSDAREPRLEVLAAAAGSSVVKTLDLWVEERRAGSTSLAVPAGGSARALLGLPAPLQPRVPVWAGRVASTSEALSEDDRVYYSVRHRAAPRVLILRSGAAFDRAGRAGWFLRGLFGGAERSLVGREADVLEASRWSEADFSRYGTVLLPDARRLPSGLSGALEAFASRGGGVWVVPGAGSSVEDLEALSSWLPARFSPPEAGSATGGLRVAKEGSETAAWGEFELDRVRLAHRFRLEPVAGSSVWLSDVAGRPLLVAGSVGRGRAVVWGSPLDLEGSNLALKPVFVPWAQACLSLTLPADGGEGMKGARVGEPLFRTWRSDEPAPDRVSVRFPDGRRLRLPVRERRAELTFTDQPGLYEFEGSLGDRLVLAVNLDPSRGESDLTPASAPPWTAVAPEGLQDAFIGLVYGRDRRGAFLGLAALALALEMLLSLPRGSAAAAGAFLLLSVGGASAQQGDRFVWTQLQLGGSWDPYPDAPDRAAAWLSELTAARVASGRRTIVLEDPALFSSPFLYLAGREAPPEASEPQLRRLRQFLAGGGFLWIEDSTGGPPGSFDRWVRRTIPQVLPEADLKPLPSDHVLYRAFFLLRGPAGRVRAHGVVEGAGWGGPTLVLYTRDDVLGAWAQDALGRPLKTCIPGGELQRDAAKRLTLNILMYSMTGSYKADAVHQSAILEKLRTGP